MTCLEPKAGLSPRALHPSCQGPRCSSPSLRGLPVFPRLLIGPCQALQGLGEGTRVPCLCWDVGCDRQLPKVGRACPHLNKLET